MIGFLLLSGSLRAQWTEIRSRARMHASAGEWTLAIHEYQRLIFLGGTAAGPRDYYQLADCQMAVEGFEAAAKNYRLVFRSGKTPAALRDSAALRSAFSSYLGGLHGEALTLLKEQENGWQDGQLAREAGLLRALILNEAGDFAGGAAELKKWFADAPETLARIDSVYAKPLKFRPKKPGMALFLSVVVPGSGQAYAGRPGDGLLSLGLAGGTAALGVFSFLQGHYAFAFLTCLPLFQKFYEGGARYAMKRAEQWNENRKTTYVKSVNQFILQHLLTHPTE